MKKKFILVLVLISVCFIQWGSSPDESVQLTHSLAYAKYFTFNSSVVSPSGRIFFFYSYYPNIWMQALSPNGETLWGRDGKPIYQRNDYNNPPSAIPDGEGGAIVVWKSYSYYFFDSKLRAQRIDQDGNLLWGPDGVVVTDLKNVSNYAFFENTISLESDGLGGVYIAFDVNFLGLLAFNVPDNRIYLQRLNANGERVFGSNGLEITSSDNSRYLYSWQAMTGDGENGVIISWIDNRYGNSAVLAQRINQFGEKLWSEPGAIVCPSMPGKRIFQTVVSDSAGGAIIGWRDKRTDSDEYALYAQRIDGDGNVLWKEDGRYAGVATTETRWWWYYYLWSWAFETSLYHVIPDGYGGAIFCWHGREGIFVQRLNENGDRQWEMNGNQVTPHITWICKWQMMTAMSAGKYVITWYDASGLYAQIFDKDGNFYIDDNKRLISRNLGIYNSLFHWAANPVYDGTGAVIFFQTIPDDRYYSMWLLWSRIWYSFFSIVMDPRLDPGWYWNFFWGLTPGLFFTLPDTQLYAQRVCEDGSIGNCASGQPYIRVIPKYRTGSTIKE